MPKYATNAASTADTAIFYCFNLFFFFFCLFFLQFASHCPFLWHTSLGHCFRCYCCAAASLFLLDSCKTDNEPSSRRYCDKGVCKAENGRVKRHRAAAAEDPLSYVRYDNALTLSSIERFVAQGLAPVSKLTLTLIFAAAPTLASKCLYAGAATYADKPQFVMLRASRPPACLKFL